MATATKGTKSKATNKPKATAPPPEPEVEETDDELEALAEAAPTETAPKGGSSQEVTFGASDLAKHLSKKHGKEVSAREIRTLIRKMARDGSGRVTREITAGNRSRYNWSGVDDPEVKAIIAAFEGGELEADKQEKLAALKAKKQAERAAAKAEAEADDVEEEEDEAPAPKAKVKAKTTKTTKKAAPAPAAEEEDEDLDLEDDDEDGDE
jgi:hypothetical protein